ncbi:unnamed protein product [Ceratitis capitata]|uniref:(Mediterranean fruit fly) hypothetical protein n=1 Tax=Ceratitis capitata TaxID=7213 RepID=A0A811UPF5_CERCA|nr:unnamed protein product [Ceratitis capitata]
MHIAQSLPLAVSTSPPRPLCSAHSFRPLIDGFVGRAVGMWYNRNFKSFDFAMARALCLHSHVAQTHTHTHKQESGIEVYKSTTPDWLFIQQTSDASTTRHSFVHPSGLFVTGAHQKLDIDESLLRRDGTSITKKNYTFKTHEAETLQLNDSRNAR